MIQSNIYGRMPGSPPGIARIKKMIRKTQGLIPKNSPNPPQTPAMIPFCRRSFPLSTTYATPFSRYTDILYATEPTWVARAPAPHAWEARDTLSIYCLAWLPVRHDADSRSRSAGSSDERESPQHSKLVPIKIVADIDLGPKDPLGRGLLGHQVIRVRCQMDEQEP